MMPFAPAPFRPVRLAQQQAAPMVPPAAPSAVTITTPGPDPLYTGYTGLPGFLETLLVLAATGAGAWVGIRTGLREKQDKVLQAAGWIGGVGSVLAGLLYLGGKSGVGMQAGLPAVRVTPT